MTNRNTLFKYILEALLIFGSVYGAFLLEAKRSIAFERDLLVGKLEKLLEEIDSDSIQLIGTFQDISDSIYNVYLKEDLQYDSIAVSLLYSQNQNMYDSLWSMFSDKDIFLSYDEDVWIESWDSDYSIYRQIMNSSNLFISPQFYNDIKKYRWRREILYNEWIKKLNRIAGLNDYLEEKYNLFNVTDKVSRQIINEPIFQNTLWAEAIQNEHLIEQSKSVLELIPDIKTKIKEEINAQKN